jgi:hypothetical protein
MKGIETYSNCPPSNFTASRRVPAMVCHSCLLVAGLYRITRHRLHFAGSV